MIPGLGSGFGNLIPGFGSSGLMFGFGNSGLPGFGKGLITPGRGSGRGCGLIPGSVPGFGSGRVFGNFGSNGVLPGSGLTPGLRGLRPGKRPDVPGLKFGRRTFGFDGISGFIMPGLMTFGLIELASPLPSDDEPSPDDDRRPKLDPDSPLLEMPLPKLEPKRELKLLLPRPVELLRFEPEKDRPRLDPMDRLNDPLLLRLNALLDPPLNPLRLKLLLRLPLLPRRD